MTLEQRLDEKTRAELRKLRSEIGKEEAQLKEMGTRFRDHTSGERDMLLELKDADRGPKFWKAISHWRNRRRRN